MWPKRKKGKSRGTKSKLKALKPDGSLDDAEENGTEPETQPVPEPIPYAQEPPQVTASNSQEDLISGVWKSKVLNNYKKNPKDSHNLLARIPTGKAAFEAGERQKEELIKESMTRIVDRMFDNFQNTAYEFNQVTGGSDLELTWTRPSFAREDTSAWHETSKSINDVFAGRISTRYWTLAVRGTTQSIGVFILPADKLLAFTTAPNQFATYCHIRPVCDGMNVTWLIDGREIEQDLLPSVYRALLDGLIRFANEEAVPNEQFSLHDIGIVPEPPPPSNSFVQSTQFSSSAQHSTQGFSASAQFSTDASEFSQASSQGDLFGPEPERRGRPVDGFINDISSQVAMEAQSEADKIRESISQAQVAQAQAQMSASSSFSTGQLDSGFASRNVSGQHGNTDTDWRSVSNNKGADWRQFMESTKEQIAPQADDDKWNAVPGTQKLLAGQTSDSLSRVSSGSYTTGSAGATYQNQPAQPFQQPPMQQMLQQPVMQHPMYADPNQNVLAHMESEQPPQPPQQSPNSTIPNLVPPPGYEPLPAHVLQNIPSSTQSGMQPGTPPSNGSQQGAPNNGMQQNMAQNGMQPSGMQPGMTNSPMQQGMQQGMQFPGTTQSGMQPGMQYPGMANNGIQPNQMQPGMQPGMQQIPPPNQIPPPPAMPPNQVPPAMQYPGMTHNSMPPGMQQSPPPALPGMTPSGMQPGMNQGLPPTLPGMTRSGMQPGMNQGLPPTLPGMTPSGMQPGMQLPGMQPAKLPGLQPGLQPGMQPNQTYSGNGMPPQMMPSTPQQTPQQSPQQTLQQTEPVSRQNLHSGPYGSVSGRPIHDPRAFQPPEPAPEEHVPYLLSESDFDEKQQKQYPYEVEQSEQSADQAPQNEYEEQARQLLEQHQDQHNLKFGQEPEYQSYEEFQQAQQDPTAVGEPTDQSRDPEQAEPIDEDQSEHTQEQYEQQAEQYERQTEEYEQQVEQEQEFEQPAEEQPEQPAEEEPAGEEPAEQEPAEQEPDQPIEQEAEQPEEVEQPAEQSEQPAEESAEETGESEELPSQQVEDGTGADGGFPEKSYTELPAVTPMAPKPVTFEMPLPDAAKLVAAKAQIGSGYDVDPDLYDAVSVVLATIDNQIERLTKQGAAAFASRDFRQAESIIKLSERLTAFKQEAEELIKQLSVKED